MSATDDSSGSNKEQLRELAEQHVPRTPTDVSSLSNDEIERLVYELEVHQEELEIQNEELRRAQVELRESGNRFADLYDFAPVGYLTINEEGSILEANLTAATMLGRERSKLIGGRLAFHCHEDSRVELRDHLDQVFVGRQSQSCEIKLSDADGNVLYARLDSNFVATDGDDGQCRTALTNITNRKLAEFALAEKDLYLRSLVEAVPVLICHVDTELRVGFTNTAYEKWFGLSTDALKGQNIRDTLGVECEAEFEEALAKIATGRRVDFEFQLTHPTKGERHLQVMLVPDIGPDADARGAHVLCTDISERKIVEAQNARLRDFAERLSRLTADERDVYKMLIRGRPNKAIAFQLSIGLRTAERRRQNILEKLEVESLPALLQQLSVIHDTVD